MTLQVMVCLQAEEGAGTQPEANGDAAETPAETSSQAEAAELRGKEKMETSQSVKREKFRQWLRLLLFQLLLLITQVLFFSRFCATLLWSPREKSPTCSARLQAMKDIAHIIWGHRALYEYILRPVERAKERLRWMALRFPLIHLSLSFNMKVNPFQLHLLLYLSPSPCRDLHEFLQPFW